VLKIKLYNFLLLKMAKRKFDSYWRDDGNTSMFLEGKNEWEAECFVCKPVTCISVSHKVWQM